MSDLERAIELGILSIGGFDVDQCACDPSVDVYPCHYCAEWGAIFAGRRALEKLAAVKAENADLVEKYNFELEELRSEIKRLKSGVQDVASLCTNCNNLDDAQAELWKLLKDETPRSGCAPCEWDANEDRYEECRKLLRAAINGTRIVPSGDGKAMHYLAITGDWYDDAEKLTKQ